MSAASEMQSFEQRAVKPDKVSIALNSSAIALLQMCQAGKSGDPSRKCFSAYCMIRERCVGHQTCSGGLPLPVSSSSSGVCLVMAAKN